MFIEMLRPHFITVKTVFKLHTMNNHSKYLISHLLISIRESTPPLTTFLLMHDKLYKYIYDNYILVVDLINHQDQRLFDLKEKT